MTGEILQGAVTEGILHTRDGGTVTGGNQSGTVTRRGAYFILEIVGAATGYFISEMSGDVWRDIDDI